MQSDKQFTRQAETDFFECKVEGVLPPDLQGALFRLGGIWYYPPKFADDIPLHADGFVSMFRISDGRAGYSGRFVKTERLTANREAGRMRFGYYRNRGTDDADVAHLNASAANTSAFAFDGKLLALKEDSLPYRIDPVTLETMGLEDFCGQIASRTFTAHPKVDGKTGELITFGYQATGPLSDDIYISIFSPEGALVNDIRVSMPWLDMIHDMAVTQDYILLPLGGFTVDKAALANGGALWRWDSQAPARIGIMRRDGDGSDLKWFSGPKRCLLHVFNAFQEGGRVFLDAPFYNGNPFPFLPSHDGSPWQADFGTAFVRRITIDPANPDSEWSEDILFDTVIGDLGDIDPRVAGYKHRFCFAGHEAGPDVEEGLKQFVRPPWPIANSYIRFDVQERTQQMLRLPAHMMLSEATFVPRSDDAAEGAGYLLGVADDLVSGASSLIVADAEHLERGPLAQAHLPIGAGPQVHGCWVSEGDLPLRDFD